MDYIRTPFWAAWGALARPFRPQIVEHPVVTPFDVYAEHFLNVVLWEDKKVTLKYFVFVNQFVWLSLLLNLKPFGALFLVILISFLVDRFYREKLYTDYTGRHRKLVDDIGKVLPKVWLGLCNLRNASRALFAMVMCLSFMWLNLMSRLLSGTSLIILLTLITFVVPIGFKMLNAKLLICNQDNVENKVLAEDELIPFIADKDLDNKDPELESLLTDKTADSASTSFTAGLVSMPSYLEIAGASEEIQEEDLVPQGPARAPSVPSSDSDDGAPAPAVQFDSDHFAGSSSEEEALLAGALLARPPQRNDSDSDFEFVNTEDLKD